MGQLRDDYSISQDGTIVRDNKAEAPKGSNGAGLVISIIVVCLSLIFIGVLISKLNDALNYANSMNSSFSYPTWQSANHNNNTTSVKEYTLALDGQDVLEVNCSVSSELNYDILTITLIDPFGNEDVLCSSSGKESHTIYRTIHGAGGVYRLKAQYRKDGSYSKNGDVASIDGLYVHKNSLRDIMYRLSW